MKKNSSADAYKGFLDDISRFSSERAEEARPAAEEDEEATPIGERVRRVREEKGLTVEDVSKRTGLDSAYLTRIETEDVSPPLGALIRIAKALDMKLGRFISSGEVKPFTVVRKDERRVISRHTSSQGDQYGYTYESLAPDKKDRDMEPFLVTLLPSGAKTEPSAHAGQEFIYVLQGSMEVTLDDYTGILNPGDSVYYDSTVPHLVRCHGEEETLILAVLTTESE
jgi:transcriptional regulator with XRE-family HTH domain